VLSRFLARDRLLLPTQPLWRVQPFHHLDLPWLDTHPAQCEALSALDLPALQGLEQDALGRQALLWPLVPQAAELAALCRLPRLPSSAPAVAPAHVPGRKWAQIWAFAQQLDMASWCEPGPILEWCAGKGHLGRLPARQGQPVVSLEWDADLCQAARRLSVGLPQRIVQQDVLASGSGPWLAGARQLRWQELSWRLTFDALQRDLRGEETYLPLPSFAKARLAGELLAFIRWAADIKGLTLPAQLDLTPYQHQAQARLAQVLRMELVLGLLCDYALYLQEQDYGVSLAEFCERPLTPRNILLQAHKIAFAEGR